MRIVILNEEKESENIINIRQVLLRNFFFQCGATYNLISFQIVRHMTAGGWFFPFIPIFISKGFYMITDLGDS